MLLVANASFKNRMDAVRFLIYTQALLLYSELFEVCLESTEGNLKVKSYGSLSERGHESIQGDGGGGGGGVCVRVPVCMCMCACMRSEWSLPARYCAVFFMLLLLAIIVSFVRSVAILINPFAPDANRSELVTAAGRRVHTPCGVGLPQRFTGHHC